MIMNPLCAIFQVRYFGLGQLLYLHLWTNGLLLSYPSSTAHGSQQYVLGAFAD